MTSPSVRAASTLRARAACVPCVLAAYAFAAYAFAACTFAAGLGLARPALGQTADGQAAGAHARAEPPTFARYTRADGLPSNYVFAVFQDRDGFVWLGTDSGVARYDGANVRTFASMDGFPGGLVYAIAQDAAGRLWFGTYDAGLVVYDGRAFAQVTPADGLLGAHVRDVATDAFGRVYALHAEGVSVVTPRANRAAASAADASETPAWTASVLRVSGLGVPVSARFAALDDGRLLAPLTPDSLLVLRPSAARIRAAVRALPPDASDMPHRATLVVAHGRTAWVLRSQQGGSMQVDRLTASGAGDLAPRGAPVVVPSVGRPETALAGPHGPLLVGTTSGLYAVDLGADAARARPLATGPYVTALARDYEGTVWAGTYGRGVLKRVGDHLRVYPAGRLGAVRRVRFGPHGGVYAVAEHGIGRVAGDSLRRVLPQVGEARALAWLDGGGTAATHRAGVHVFDRLDAARPRASRTVASWPSDLHRDGDTLWVSSYGDGVLRARLTGSPAAPLGPAWQDTLTTGDGLASNVVDDLVATRSGLWMLTRAAGATRRRRSGTLATVARAHGLPSDAVYAAYEDAAGATWLGTDAGVVRLPPGFAALPPATLRDAVCVLDHEGQLRGQRILALFEAAPASPGDTLSPKGEASPGNETLPGSETLPGDEALPARPALWAVGERLLYRIVRKAHVDDSGAATRMAAACSWRLRAYGSAPLRPPHLADASIDDARYDARTRRLWLATTSGLVAVRLDALRRNRTPPRVAFTAVTAGGEALSLGLDRVRPAPVVLPHTRSDLVVGFAPLTFAHEAGARVQHRLDDRPWSPPSPARTVELADLADGPHRLAVRAVSADGVPSAAPAVLHVRITPPFWRAPWFRGAAFVAVLALGTAGGRILAQRRLRRAVRQMEAEQRLHRERARISRDLHDHVGAQLSTIISGLELVHLNAERGRTRDVQRYLAALDDDARTTMAQLRETIWALHHERVTGAAFAEQVRRDARRQTRYRPRLSVRVTVEHAPGEDAQGHAATRGDAAGGDAASSDAAHAWTLSPLHALNLFRIAQEALANACKHADARAVRVTIRAGADGVTLTVADDGAFRPTSATHGDGAAGGPEGCGPEGYGLAGMRQRAHDLGGTFALTTDGGTTVRVTVPLEA